MSEIPWLEGNQAFPPTDSAMKDPSGLLAAGADLSPPRLLNAYRRGIFPWFEEDQPILWWSPDPRATLIPSAVHISRSLRKAIKQQQYQFRFDTHFLEVIQACAEARSYTEGTWITDEMCEAYENLHRMGIAHSVEVWDEDKLVGGLYGIALGKVFFGESMFSRASNTSKMALVYLAEHLHKWGFELIDCQVENSHLMSLGAQCISRKQFDRRLKDLIKPNESSSLWGVKNIDIGN